MSREISIAIIAVKIKEKNAEGRGFMEFVRLHNENIFEKIIT
jgi:hypothetical protein